VVPAMWPSTDPAAGSEVHPQERDELSCDVGQWLSPDVSMRDVGDASAAMLRSRRCAAAQCTRTTEMISAMSSGCASASGAGRFCRSSLTDCGHELPSVASGGAPPAAYRRCCVWA
jgi:hypothetical protein